MARLTAAEAPRAAPRPRPDLLVRPGATWGWWPQVLLRAPGFPAAGIRRLAAPTLARRADELVAAGSADDAAFAAAYDREMTRLSAQVREIAASPDFQRALAWQNHHALRAMVDPLLRGHPPEGGRNRKWRRREEFVAVYWQRYCVKNDTIGFFGPIGFGHADPRAAATTQRPGPRLLASSEVFFEPWAIDRLAELLSGDPRLRRWIAPRRVPFVTVEGESVRLPGSPPVSVSAAEAAVLRAADGTVPALRIGRPSLAETEVVSILESLERRRWLVWRLELPVGPHPEAALRGLLERVGDEGLRRSALARLDELVAARDRVASAAEDAGALRAALDRLDATFTRLTGAAPMRNAGRTYGGRTLVYLDARRDVELALGRDVLDAAAPLDLLAESARWVCYRLSEALRPTLLKLHDRVEPGPDGRVDLTSFWLEALRPVGRAARGALAEIESDLVETWARLLRIEPGASRASYAADELRPGVRDAFRVPASGWDGARYIGPDVMIAARDLAAVGRGEFALVLGDFHLAINTQRTCCFVTQHPDPDELLRAVDRDFPRPRLLPVLPRESPPRLSVRTHPALVRDRDYLVALTHQTVPPERPRLLLGTDVAVAARDDVLVAVLPNGDEHDLLDLFAEILMDLVMDRFRILSDAPHVSRVSFDRLIVSREAWTFDARELEFAFERNDVRRFVAARAWRARNGLTPQLFVKSPLELKPFYVDLDSPVYASILAKAVRAVAAAPDGTGGIRFSELLPRLDELWLEDARGHRYTAELRLVGFDLLPPVSEAVLQREGTPG